MVWRCAAESYRLNFRLPNGKWKLNYFVRLVCALNLNTSNRIATQAHGLPTRYKLYIWNVLPINACYCFMHAAMRKSFHALESTIEHNFDMRIGGHRELHQFIYLSRNQTKHVSHWQCLWLWYFDWLRKHFWWRTMPIPHAPKVRFLYGRDDRIFSDLI